MTAMTEKNRSIVFDESILLQQAAETDLRQSEGRVRVEGMQRAKGETCLMPSWQDCGLGETREGSIFISVEEN